MKDFTILKREANEHQADEFLLSVQGLNVEFRTSRGILRAVQDISYDVRPGETIAIVGESGSGKSVSALAVLGLLPERTAQVTKGRILFEGRNLLTLSKEEMRRIRGRDIGMIFQDPMSSLNPVLTIGDQLTEPLKIHLKMSSGAAAEQATELLTLVGISDARRRLEQYPYEFSGGMRQRVMIAIGIACKPKLLIADEPTTALDVTIQAQILDLMKRLSRELGIALVIITHNLGLVARYADRVNVMYAAQLVESAEAKSAFSTPHHPYTVGLLRSVPRLDHPREDRLPTIDGLPPNLLHPPKGCRFADRCPARIDICSIEPPLNEVATGHFAACHRAHDLTPEFRATLFPAIVDAGTVKRADVGNVPALRVEGLTKHFWVRQTRNLISTKKVAVRAVEDVSFMLERGKTLGLVGESGCGKSTIGRSILRLLDPTAGDIFFEGKNISQSSQKELVSVRRRLQVIFQDPYASLNPRMTVGQIIAEPLNVYSIVRDGDAANRRVSDLLESVGLYTYMADRYPHELSGGQRQRVGIARALAMEPSTIVCDEPVSALDVSVQAQIINLLVDLQRDLDLSYLFIAHDLAVVRHISDNVVVMYLGRIMEAAECDELYASPLHPYTKALLDAAPVADVLVDRQRSRDTLKGEIPSPINPPPGCVFSSRCPLATDECRAQVPALREVRPGHYVACIKVDVGI
jgi:peptide/nickel transport system ATP-binding protein